MATQFSVNITLSSDTVSTLHQQNFTLYGFRAVVSSAETRPVVWFHYDTYQLINAIEWTDEYQAYVSQGEMIPGGAVRSASPYPVQLGQVLQITSAGGIGQVRDGGSPTAIGIANLTSTVFTCGLSLPVPGASFSPICAVPLLANNKLEIIPLDKVLLMFASAPVSSGTVIHQTYGQGILIDLTGVSTRSVSYDAEAGWSWPDHAPWAQVIPASEDLISLLNPSDG
jgi:hypothetical protein